MQSGPWTRTKYLYDGPDLVAEYVNGALAERFVHGAGADEPLVWFQGSGTSSPSFLHADERGSIIAASDATGAVAASVKYGSYGESGALVSPFGYTGQLYMPDLQLYYYKARMYSAQTGRFMQPDPSGYQDNTNLYAYVDGDPVNLGDTSGLGISCMPVWKYSDVSIGDQDGNRLHGGTPVPYIAGLDCQYSPDPGSLGAGNYGSAPQQIPCAAGVSCYLPPQKEQQNTAETLCQLVMEHATGGRPEDPGSAGADVAGFALTVTEQVPQVAPNPSAAVRSIGRVAGTAGNLVAGGQVVYGIINGVRTGDTGDLGYQSFDLLATSLVTVGGGGVPGGLLMAAYNAAGGSKTFLNPSPATSAVMRYLSACEGQ